MEKKEFIQKTKKRDYIYFSMSLISFVVSLFFIFIEIGYGAFLRIFWIISAVIFGIGSLAIWSLIKNKARIIISQEGLTYYTEYFRKLSPIHWNDIISFSKETVTVKITKKNKKIGEEVNHEYIVASINNDSSFRDAIADMNESLGMRSEERNILDKYGKNTLIINPQLFDIPTDDLLDVLKKAKISYNSVK